MRVLARRLEKLEAKLIHSTLGPVDRLLSQVNAALTAREKVLIGEADELNLKGRESEINQNHRTALERRDALFSLFLDERHITDQELESLIADLEMDAVASRQTGTR